MSQGPLCPNLTQKVQKEVSQMVNRNFSPVILLGGLSVNLNHLKKSKFLQRMPTYDQSRGQSGTCLKNLARSRLYIKQVVPNSATLLAMSSTVG